MPTLIGLTLFAVVVALGSPSQAETPICQRDYEQIKNPDVWNPVEAVVKAGIPQGLKDRLMIVAHIADSLRAKGYGQREVGTAVWFTTLVIGAGAPPNDVPVPMRQAADQIFKTCSESLQSIERGRSLREHESPGSWVRSLE